MKERYLYDVRSLLDCAPRERERLISRLDRAVSAYLEDAPEAGKAELYASFGTPEDCAAGLSAECPPEAVAAEKKKQKKRQRILTRVLAGLLVITMGIVVYLWSNGGLVIIQLREPGDKEDWGKITYTYQD